MPKRKITPERLVGRQVQYVRSDLRYWRQPDLAQRLKEQGFPIHQTALSKIETGSRGVTVNELWSLARALNCNPNALMLPAYGDDSYAIAIGNHLASSGEVVLWCGGAAPLDDPTPDDAEQEVSYFSHLATAATVLVALHNAQERVAACERALARARADLAVAEADENAAQRLEKRPPGDWPRSGPIRQRIDEIHAEEGARRDKHR